MYDTLIVGENKAVWPRVDRPHAARGKDVNRVIVKTYLWTLHLSIRYFGDDCWLLGSMDHLLNCYLSRYGLEYVRVERLG